MVEIQWSVRDTKEKSIFSNRTESKLNKNSSQDIGWDTAGRGDLVKEQRRDQHHRWDDDPTWSHMRAENTCKDRTESDESNRSCGAKAAHETASRWFIADVWSSALSSSAPKMLVSNISVKDTEKKTLRKDKLLLKLCSYWNFEILVGNLKVVVCNLPINLWT